jgi:hypothetical protein
MQKKKTEPHSTLIDKLRQVTGLNVEPESVTQGNNLYNQD